MQSLESQTDRDKFQSMVPLMLGTIGHVLNANEETAAQEALEMFIEVRPFLQEDRKPNEKITHVKAMLLPMLGTVRHALEQGRADCGAAGSGDVHQGALRFLWRMVAFD